MHPTNSEIHLHVREKVIVPPLSCWEWSAIWREKGKSLEGKRGEYGRWIEYPRWMMGYCIDGIGWMSGVKKMSWLFPRDGRKSSGTRSHSKVRSTFRWRGGGGGGSLEVYSIYSLSEKKNHSSRERVLDPLYSQDVKRRKIQNNNRMEIMEGNGRRREEGGGEGAWTGNDTSIRTIECKDGKWGRSE